MSLCKKCEGRIVMHAFSNSECQKCSKKICSSTTPPNKICLECSKNLGKCEFCGGDIRNE